jgi:YegS/Rv2252/BmrU family lipid kinase
VLYNSFIEKSKIFTKEKNFRGRKPMYHIIINPVSGKNRGLKNLRKVEKILEERGVAYEVHQSSAVRDAEDIVRGLTEAGEYDIIVLGGDGTLHEVLNGIADPSRCKLGLVPSGTGNDFAEKLSLSKKVDEAMKTILDGEAKDVDYLDVGGVRCMNVAGVGMDVDVLERCQKGKFRGKIKYFMSLLKSIFAFKGYPIVVNYDGKEEKHDALLAAVCNGAQFGGGIPICPPAVVDDGKMNVLIVDHIKGKLNLCKALVVLMLGKMPTFHKAKHFLCDKIRFTPLVPCTLQLDGELYKGLDFNVKICKGLKMYR